MPHYNGAAYAGESMVLSNERMRLEVCKRVTGWGWAEIQGADGQLMAVLEYLGEVKLPGSEIPLFMEADTYRLDEGDFGQRLTFEVKLTPVKERVRTSDFGRWFTSTITEPIIEGTVSITLEPGQGALVMDCMYRPKCVFGVRYLRGPWLKVGVDSFGIAKQNGILPGVEWLDQAEWSSGNDWFVESRTLRVAPHPFKVAIPVMALSHEGSAIGLAWDATARVMSQLRYVQPVFASLNFIQRENSQIMGLMIPSAAWDIAENQAEADPPLELGLRGPIAMRAEIVVVPGSSLDVVSDWVKHHGMLALPGPRYPCLEALDRIAQAYDSNLWHEGQGWGGGLWGPIGSHEPWFLKRYIEENGGTPLANSLAQKVDWVRAQPGHDVFTATTPLHLRSLSHQEQLARAEEILGNQQPDGSFRFEPNGRHKNPTFYNFSDAIAKPLGQDGDTALDLIVLPALELLILADLLNDDQLRLAAIKALDFCLAMDRPEGGDFWETPLHSPNLFAAGHAANAYALAYRVFNDECYKQAAIHWIRSLLPFTHLWEPFEIPMVYKSPAFAPPAGTLPIG